MNISNIKVTNFSINEKIIEGWDINELKDRIQLRTQSILNIQEDKDQTLVKLKIIFQTKEEIESIFEITVESIFNLSPLKELIKTNTEGENIFIDNNIAYTLLGLTFSTTRGIIFEKLKGSLLQNLILPVVDPKKLLNGIKEN